MSPTTAGPPGLAFEPNVVIGLSCTRGAGQVDHAAEEYVLPGLGMLWGAYEQF